MVTESFVTRYESMRMINICKGPVALCDDVWRRVEKCLEQILSPRLLRVSTENISVVSCKCENV
jgi:hypothetical protein